MHSMNERGRGHSLILRGRNDGLSVMSSSSAMSDHNDSNFVTSYTPLLRMPSKCINKCGKQVNQAGNHTCDTCMKAMKAAMTASGMENFNINIVNRPSGYYWSNNCGSRVTYKSDVCLTCAKAQGLLSGDISGKTKAFNAIRRDTDWFWSYLAGAVCNVWDFFWYKSTHAYTCTYFLQ